MINRVTTIIVFTLYLCQPLTGLTADLSAQRSLYRKAAAALAEGDTAAFRALAERLQGYPLAPWLQYEYLRARLTTVKEAAIADFIGRYGGTLPAARLQTAWLRVLAKGTDHHRFLHYYTPQDDVALQCRAAAARLETKADVAAIDAGLDLWLVGESRPDACDPVFTWLRARGRLLDTEVWQRIGLAMDNDATGLANHLARYLPAADQPWVARWIAMHSDPKKGFADPALARDQPESRQILIHGIKRLARGNADDAIRQWQKISEKYQFSKQERGDALRHIGLAAAGQDHPQAIGWLDAIPASAQTYPVQQTRLRTALIARDWEALARWTALPAATDMNPLRWRYWRARALEQTGNTQSASKLFWVLAKERDYYGFQAADRLGASYAMINRPPLMSAQQKQQLAASPGIAMAREFFLTGERARAAQVWSYAMSQLPRTQVEQAAALANEWGWYHQAIATLGQIDAYDDLNTRFPMPYRDLIEKHAKRQELEPALVYSIIRSESAFLESARSPAGALGLMQVMPQTGHHVAGRIGLEVGDIGRQLTQANTNIVLGSAYMREMLQRYDGNIAMMAAAYNAGPHRVNAWRPQLDCVPTDVWIDTIPFRETRRYVRRILFYTAVYEWRMARNITKLNQRVAAVTPPNHKGRVLLSCKTYNTKTLG